MVSNSATFVALIVFVVILLVAGRGVLKALFTPFRKLLAFTIRALRATVRIFRGQASANAQQRVKVGVAPLTALLRILELNANARIGLGDMPKETEAMIHREGTFFGAVNADRVADGVTDSLTPEDAAANVALSDLYYAGVMTYDVSPAILYEESEEELLIGILKDSDRSFFAVLRRLKKNIGQNVIRIVAMLTGLVFVFPYLASLAILMLRDKTGQWAVLNGTYYVLLCLLFFLLMVFFRWAYSNSATKNGFHFNYFASTYFSRLANQYKSAATHFANVLNDRQLDLDTIESESNKWFLNLQWLAARQWFLELFARNIIFQIGRNMWWYALIVVASAVGAWWFIEYGLEWILTPFAGHIPTARLQPTLIWSWEMVAPFALLLVTYFFTLGGLLARFWSQINSAGWLDFRKMGIKGLIESTVGSLVREVVDKRRSPYGSGPPPPR
jgi:hypothetical protein